MSNCYIRNMDVFHLKSFQLGINNLIILEANILRIK